MRGWGDWEGPAPHPPSAGAAALPAVAQPVRAVAAARLQLHHGAALPPRQPAYRPGGGEQHSADLHRLRRLHDPRVCRPLQVSAAILKLYVTL